MQPLWSNEAEQSVIGAVMINDRVTPDLAAIVQPEDFYSAAHRDIFRAVLAMHARGEPIDVVTLGDAVRAEGHTAAVGQIAADTFSAANAVAHADRVSDYARRRALIAACHAAIDDTQTQTADEVIAELGAALESAGKRSIGESLDWSAVLQDMINTIEQATKAGDDGIVGVRTGIAMIDKALGGLCVQRFYVVAARPGAGKTALCNQIAANIGSRGEPMGICSLEMGADEIGMRAMAYKTRTNFTLMGRGDNEALDSLINGMQRFDAYQWPLHLDTSTYSLAGIEARITSWVRNHGIKAAIVDHIGLVEVEGNVSTYDRVSLVSRRLKKLAKRLNIAVIGVSQLNRALEKEKRRPNLGDLRDSGNVEQDIDAGVFLHVDPEDAELEVIPVNVGFLKNRTGRKGWDPNPLFFEGQYQTFREHNDRYDDYADIE